MDGYFVATGKLSVAACLFLSVFTYIFEVILEELLFRGFLLIGIFEAVLLLTGNIRLSAVISASVSSLLWIVVGFLF